MRRVQSGWNYDEVSVTRTREGESCEDDIEEEITADCRYYPGSGQYWSSSLGNWHPGDPPEFDYDSSSFKIDGRPATEQEVKEIIADEELMLKLEEQARLDY